MADSPEKRFSDCFDFSSDLSLYIHVPFCISKCAYCGFYSEPGCDASLIDSFTDKIVREISAVNEKRGHRPYDTAFIGGGNPGCLGPENLGRIAQAVCEIGRPAEFSTEMNPESLDRRFFPLFGKYFTRLSMGVQSLDQKALSFLGRNADLEQTRRGLALSQDLRKETGCVLNYDLITCLGPWHDALSDAREIVQGYAPEHMSVYALTLEEGTPLYRRNPDLPDSDEQYTILREVGSYLAANGYGHYEVSNYAKEGYRCVHNSRYWAYRQYMGLGPGAASTAFSADGKVTRINFRPSVRTWLEAGLFGGCDIEPLTETEACEELVFMGLRHKAGLDLNRLEGMARRDIDRERIRNLKGFREEGGFLVPDEDGLMTADAAALELIGALSDHGR
ncbi:MAG: coproporphyrinogen III oxidase family protein [Spirochaetales bacterium]|nr:coproporphyrinogen III oxidase family protein [Spirochaetales bacterium]